MSTSVSYPILRTSDPAPALSVARRLVEFGSRSYSDVSVEAEVPTLAEARRLRDSLPEAWFTSWSAPSDPDPGVPALFRGVPSGELPDDLTSVERFLPFSVSMLDQPLWSIEDHFFEVAGACMGVIHWSSLEWPPAPERDLYGEFKHAEVTLLLNCDSRDLEVRADTHLVLVHVRRRNGDGYEDRVAQWVAEQVGREAIGPARHP